MRTRTILLALALPLLVLGCAGNVAAPAASLTPFEPTTYALTAQALATFTPAATATATLTATPSYPDAGLGPTGFPAGVDPLTGLPVADAGLLERRPIVVKVENLPREHRPQFGLTSADIVYEYYTEEGTTRFAAVYYGQDGTPVGPIRSARFFDTNVVQMYKALFVFGYADYRVMNALWASDFSDRLIVEGPASSPALYRSSDLLLVDTSRIKDILHNYYADNNSQNLEGMFFQMQTPTGGSLTNTVTVRYSAAIYDRWTYDIVSHTYLRAVDAANAYTPDQEQYTPLTDRNNGQQISANNVVVLYVPISYVVHTDTTEIVNMSLVGSGTAYIFRDGQGYQVTWYRPSASAVLTLTNPDGTLFPFRPGVTWFEVIGSSSVVQQIDPTSWRFTFSIP
jgi:hypothetical protein